MSSIPSSTTKNAFNGEEPALIGLLKKAAAQEVARGDPWAQYHLEKIPAERIVRHLYDPSTGTWSIDETIVKMEANPFTRGAMRHCFRMKKRAQHPKHATNHHFHKTGWSYASNNYVAKAYMTKDGQMDCSEEAKQAVQNDIKLQYEAQHWSNLFNQQEPPTKINFIRAYAIEFPHRPGQPWMAVERFITGKDVYGAGFVKHNTNAGYVDTDLRRVTPQVFSAFSFYKSQGKRLVADIQGVGDLYTDPQVLSECYEFGEGDLGPRGMALFFHSYRSCGTSDAMGVPIFPLSRNEIKAQAKYEEEEVTVSDDEQSFLSGADHVPLDAFQKLDLNRQRRSMILKRPPANLFAGDNEKDTLQRSNIAIGRSSISSHVRKSLTTAKKPVLRRTTSDVDEVTVCLKRAQSDRVYTHRDYHRLSSGELRERKFKDDGTKDVSEELNGGRGHFHKSAKQGRVISAPLPITDETRKNLGKVHYQLAVLHGSGRFPQVVPTDANHIDDPKDTPDHDAQSVLFHLSYAAALKNAPACLALARVQAGMDTHVSDLLRQITPVDFDAAKLLLHRAMTSPHPPTKPKVAAGCLLFQILHDEMHVGMSQTSDTEIMSVLKEALELLDVMEGEEMAASEHNSRMAKSGGVKLHPGDRVEADYCLEGTFYPGVVENVSGEGSDCRVTVKYDDDGSSETLALDRVRLIIPPTATQTSLGGPLSDEEVFGGEGGDDSFLLTKYELEFDLAELMEKKGDLEEASALYSQAADGALSAGKMKLATEWSLKAADLES